MPTIVSPPHITPLAAVLRPKTLDDIIGQDHLLGPGKPIRMMAIKRRTQSSIIWGPPGTGKTSLIRALALDTESVFCPINATDATIKDLRAVIKAARARQPQSTFVFIDEVHRFSKNQQDVLLPVVEDGTIILFGATTEKPKFAVNPTILSRCIVLETKPLDMQASINLIKRVKSHYKGKGQPVRIEHDAAQRLILMASGDARKIITVLETAIEILSDDGHITIDHINVAMPDKHLVFDARGNDHFDLAHCYQEAVQHSDADAAVYWLCKWVASGEDPAYIARRMIVTAFEDAGDSPMAILSAMAAHYAVERVGLPECLIPMSHATIAAAQSGRDKTAYKAVKAAMSDVENGEIVHVPPGLRAGTAGYVAAIIKKYVDRPLVLPTCSSVVPGEQQQSDQPHEIMYAIGAHFSGESYGMSRGPTPNVEDMLDVVGEPGDYIFRFNDDQSNDKIYQWTENGWLKLDD